MRHPITVHLRDLGEPLVDAWRREFAGVAGVTMSCGDIFTDQPGPIDAGDPIRIKADAIVSPANSFGFMAEIARMYGVSRQTCYTTSPRGRRQPP